jgi:hypothetical protein
MAGKTGQGGQKNYRLLGGGIDELAGGAGARVIRAQGFLEMFGGGTKGDASLVGLALSEQDTAQHQLKRTYQMRLPSGRNRSLRQG